MNPSPRCVLLDRDGVLNVDLPTGVLARERLQIEASAPAAVAQLTAAGFTVLVVTNQACIGRGEVSREEVELIHQSIAEAVAAAGGRIDGWYVCPHRAEQQCACRKPQPGLLTQAQADWGFSCAATYFVGDAERDVQAALAAGCRPLIVRTGKGQHTAASVPEVQAVADLAAAAALICADANGVPQREEHSGV